MNINERMIVVETKLKTIEKLLYVVIIIGGSHVGIEVLPLVSAALG